MVLLKWFFRLDATLNYSYSFVINEQMKLIGEEVYMSLRKQISSIILSAVLVFSFMPFTAFAGDEPASADDTAVNEQVKDITEQVQEITAEDETKVEQNDATQEEQENPDIESLKDEPADTSLVEEKVDNLQPKESEPEEVAESNEESTEPIVEKKTLNAVNDSAADLIEIRTAAELNNVRKNLSGNYILMADIDLSSATKSGGEYYNSGKGWTPIGSSFTGTFDGNGYSIIGLNISGVTSITNTGLFSTNKGTIKNLILKDGTNSANSSYAGGIASVNQGTIENCINYNTIYTAGPSAMYSAGIAASNSGTITKCENHGNITNMAIKTNSSGGYVANAGGLAGKNTGSISDCLNTADISATTQSNRCNAGGICADSSGSNSDVSLCDNQGFVFSYTSNNASTASAGGIIGQLDDTNVTGCSNSGSISSSSDNGKSNAGGIADSLGNATIDSSYNTGTVVSSSESTVFNANAGGIVAQCTSETGSLIINCANGGFITSSGISDVMTGGIVGAQSGVVESCFNVGTVAGDSDNSSAAYMTYSGGITGELKAGRISKCFNRGTASSIGSSDRYALTGGICGYNNSKITECYNEGTITAVSFIGGITAYNNDTISDCYHAGTLSFTKDTLFNGGIAAINGEGASISNVYSVGTCKGDSNYGGTLIGNDLGSTSKTLNACDMCMFYTVASGDRIGNEFLFPEMEVKANYPDFDFSGTWKMGSGDYKLPILANCAESDSQNSIQIPLANVYMELAPTSTYVYNGSEVAPLVYAAGLRVRENFNISGKGKNAGTYKVKVTSIAPFTGTVNLTFKISPKKLSPKVKLSKKSFVYNGKVQKPTVALTGTSNFKLTTKDYTTTISGSKKAVGTYKVTVKLKGNFSGSATASYTIVPKGTAIKKLKAAKKGFTATWSKQATQTTGYQVQYSLKKNFSGAKTVTIKKNNTVKTTVKKLKGKKTYYVRIRTYKRTGGKNYYSAWSKAKTIKTKK